jgi:hypothetical protein
MLNRRQLAALSLSAAILIAPALAAETESPPQFMASAVLGKAAAGPGYQVAEEVGSDGYLRVYDVDTSWGAFDVHGDLMMSVRLKEIRALTALERTADSEKFGDALVNAGLRPVDFAGKLVTDPKGTIKKTVGGVGQMFNSIGSGIRNAGKTQEKAAASLSGAAKQRRLIAYNYGIDPYTSWPPLKEKLDQLSRAAAAGGLAVTGAFILIPGAAGTIISNAATANTLNEMVRDYSAAQLMDINRKALRKAGADATLTEDLLTNPHFTPTDMTALTAALASMGTLRNVNALIARAADAHSRDAAYFMRSRVELMAAHQQQTGEITGFTTLGDSPFPMAQTRDKGLLGIFPLDALAWTEDSSRAITSLTTAARDEGITGPLSLQVTGTATALARTEITALGWTLSEQIGP